MYQDTDETTNPVTESGGLFIQCYLQVHLLMLQVYPPRGLINCTPSLFLYTVGIPGIPWPCFELKEPIYSDNGRKWIYAVVPCVGSRYNTQVLSALRQLGVTLVTWQTLDDGYIYTSTTSRDSEG